MNDSQAADSFEFIRAASCPPPLLREIANFLDSQDTSHPFQFPQWAGEKSYLAVHRRQGKLCWCAQCGIFYPASRVLSLVRALAVTRGPVADDVEVMEAGLWHLVNAARRRSISVVEIIPEWTGNFAESMGSILTRNGWQRSDEARTSLRLNLDPVPEQLLASFRKVTRYESRRAERFGVEVTMARAPADYEDWLLLYSRMAREKKFEPDDFGHMRQVLRWLGTEPDRGGLLLARKDARIVGGIVIIRSGARCWYVWGATVKSEAFSPGHLLQWRAIQWARENGCREYDLGGYREGTGSGTAFFKSGFCDNLVKFMPTSRYIVSPSGERTSEIVRRLRRRLQPFRKA